MHFFLRNGKTSYIDNETNKTVNKENYKEGKLQELTIITNTTIKPYRVRYISNGILIQIPK
jgi:hypothetical protein